MEGWLHPQVPERWCGPAEVEEGRPAALPSELCLLAGKPRLKLVSGKGAWVRGRVGPPWG